jgi:repressor LexA
MFCYDILQGGIDTMKYLTEAQYKVLKCIDELIQERGISPSFKEIKEHLGLSSNSTIYTHVHALNDKGYISFIKGSPRSIRILGPYSDAEIKPRGSH